MSIIDLLQAANIRTVSVEQGQTVYQAVRQAQQQLYDLLTPLFPVGNVYPDTAGDHRSFPDCVYSVSDSGSVAYRNVDISHSILFGLSIRDPNSADLAEVFDAVAQVLQPLAGIQVIGIATGYEPDTANYVIGAEVLFAQSIGHDTSHAQPYPVLVIQGDCVAQPTPYDACIRQRVECEYHLVFHASTEADLKAQRLAASQALLGHRLYPDHTFLQYRRGEAIKADGGLMAWTDVWFDAHFISNS